MSSVLLMAVLHQVTVGVSATSAAWRRDFVELKIDTMREAGRMLNDPAEAGRCAVTIASLTVAEVSETKKALPTESVVSGGFVALITCYLGWVG
jgi:hypothetical protein